MNFDDENMRNENSETGKCTASQHKMYEKTKAKDHDLKHA